MAFIGVENNCGSFTDTPALFDSGAFPDSYVSYDFLAGLGLLSEMKHEEKKHTVANKDVFASVGTVLLTFKMPNKCTFKYEFRVADISTEVILGRNLLKALGAIINFNTDRITCVKANRCRLSMIPVDEWSEVSNITGEDFLSDKVPLPAEFQKLFPGKSLREIAEVLEGIPVENDLTVEEGQNIIARLLANEYKEITVPRKTPTPYIKPVTLPFRDGLEDVIVNIPPRTRPSLDWDRIESQVKDWLDHGKVEKSSSKFNTPHVVASKPTPPFFRLAQDFRRINELLKPMGFPLRKVDELIEEIALKKYKSGLDQDQAYTQIPVDKKDRPKLAFSTRKGKYHFCVVPYGLSISGDLYCERKATALQWDGADVLMWVYIWSYVDDDAVGTDTIVCHIFILCVIFDRFVMFGFTLRVPKCNWLVEVLKYGGHMVGYEVIKPNPKKTEKLRNLQTPKSLKELRSFLQQVSWILRRYEPEYVEHAAKLSSSFRKPNDRKKFDVVWRECNLQDAYDRLKSLCTNKLANVSFDPSCRDTYLYFDWSKLAIAGVLVQRDQIVRVWGRSCNDSESRYPSVKGENLAYHDVQLAFRAYLLSVPFFYAVTDHRPLLGLDAKADLQDMDPMFTKWREGTEQFRHRRKLLYVMGDKNLADFWSRIWPSKDLPSKDDNIGYLCIAFSKDHGDFVLKPEDKKELAGIRKNGIVFKNEGDYVKAYIHKHWRTFVPSRLRIPLIQELHLPLHLGEVKLKEKLALFYFPKKRQLVRDYLRSCSCAVAKSDGNPRCESKSSRNQRRIQANRPFDIVQIDVYNYNNWHYLTARDVSSRRLYAEPICKINTDKELGEYTRKLHRVYQVMESTWPRVPDQLVCDNESALVSIPHRNVRPGPVYHPEHNAVVERAHRELAKYCRIHNTTPDVAARIHNVELAAASSGGDVKDKLFEPSDTEPSIALVLEPQSKLNESIEHEPMDEDVETEGQTEDVSTEPVVASQRQDVGYDGRRLKIGDMVYQKVNPYSRKKQDPFWHKIAIVRRCLGATSYLVDDGKRETVHFIDNLKSFSLGESVIQHLQLNPVVIERARDFFGGLPEFDYLYADFEDFMFSHTNEVVWVGYPGTKQLPAVTKYLLKGEHTAAYLIVPDLPFEAWYHDLDNYELAFWSGIEPHEDISFWVSEDGDAKFSAPITWWLVRVLGN